MNDEMMRYGIVIGGAVLLLVLVMIVYLLARMHYRKAALAQQKQMQQRQRKELDSYRAEIETLIAKIEDGLSRNEDVNVFLEQSKRYTGEFLTGEPAVDALLTYKKNICSEAGISLQMELGQLPGSLLREDEWIALFGNLLDNAMEAAIKTDAPWVRVSNKMLQGQWILTVENTKESSQRPLESGMRSTKQTPGDHGLGTKIIDKTVKAHRGIVNREDHGETFITLIALPMDNAG